MEIIGECKDYIPSGFGYRPVKRKLGRCECGHEVELLKFTNSCGECGRDYNISGVLLAPRSQWGEETGETADDILQAGHHIS